MYEYQGFHSGEKLKATQLVAMEDGIINAEIIATEAKDSVLNLCGEYDAFEPITWDGVIGDREVVDISELAGEANTYAVKVSDAILTYEDYLGATFTGMTPDGEQAVQIVEDILIPADQVEQVGMCGVRDAISTIIDADKVNTALGINLFKTPGTYALYNPDGPMYVSSLSKTTIKKIDEKFLPELASGANMERGVGGNATQQIPRPDKVNLTNAAGQLCFEGDNPFVTDQLVPYGALGKSSTSLGGRTSAQATHSIAINSKTIAKGEESLATGYATIALGGASFSGGSQTIARAEAAVALGHKTDAAAPYTFVHGVHAIAGSLYQTVFGVANDNKENHLFEIGSGTLAEDGSVISRSNAFCVTRDGRAQVKVDAIEDNDLITLRRFRTVSMIHRGSGESSIAQTNCFATGLNCVALGSKTTASGDCAFSNGLNTQATGYYSHASGEGTIASKLAQTVVGRYNNKESREGSLFVVGSGVGQDNRQNAFEVISDGEIIIYWNHAYYSLNLMLQIIANAAGGPEWFDLAKKE